MSAKIYSKTPPKNPQTLSHKLRFVLILKRHTAAEPFTSRYFISSHFKSKSLIFDEYFQGGEYLSCYNGRGEFKRCL